MSEWKQYSEDSKKRWDENAGFWDDFMGEESNRFHRELISSNTLNLLDIQKGNSVLDVACGNGNFSRALSKSGAKVVAFDFSKTMIERAKKRSPDYDIEYLVLDATDYDALVSLGENSFNAAVSNMGLMDMAEINPLLKALYKLLKKGGKFVFSVIHPCFQTPGLKKIYEEEETGNKIIAKNCILISRYIEPETFEGIGIRNQPVASRYFHRPLSSLLNACFEAGFVLDRLEEPVFKKEDLRRFDWFDLPPVIICRLKKHL